MALKLCVFGGVKGTIKFMKLEKVLSNIERFIAHLFVKKVHLN
jgi:hypothetical protein